jgi:Glycolipid 2-alpha-mannosyltransferase
LIKGKAEFGLIPSSHWNQPDWVDEEKATAGRKKLVEEMIIYAGACARFFLSAHTRLTLALQIVYRTSYLPPLRSSRAAKLTRQYL